MTTLRRRSYAIVVLLVLSLGCSSESGSSPGSDEATDSGSSLDTESNTEVSDTHTQTGDGTDTDVDTNSDPCEPPDMLIVLDRTMSMHRQPSGDPAPQNQHELSKWFLAISAIETVTGEYDRRLRFGLELFPQDPDDGACVTLAERIDGETADNPTCEHGEVLVPTDLQTAKQIASALDPETTLLCNSTPIGAGLETALQHLASVKNAIRPQYVLLVTDGRDTCDDPDPVEQVQQLLKNGASTFVVGFDGSGKGIDSKTLNNMACAGKTAPEFDKNCVDQGGGAYVAADPSGETLFISASNGDELQNELDSVAALVGCGIVK